MGGSQFSVRKKDECIGAQTNHHVHDLGINFLPFHHHRHRNFGRRVRLDVLLSKKKPVCVDPAQRQEHWQMVVEGRGEKHTYVVRSICILRDLPQI